MKGAAKKMKRILVIYGLLIITFMLFVFYNQNMGYRNDEPNPWDQMEEGLRGTIDEKYVMVTFLSGIEYWKTAIKGFEDGAEALNVSVEYRGATQYDVNEQVTVLEQVIAKKPAGIALSVINANALTDSINKAVDAGIPVVLFDAGAEKSKAYSFLATNNYNAGVTAAHKMAELIGGKGKIAVVTLPNQLNHQERTIGFQETIFKKYPQMEVVAIKDGKGDQLISGQVAAEVFKQHPDLKGIFVTEANGGVGVGQVFEHNKKVKIISFDIDKGTLDMVKEGTISATLAQGTWNMGYWSLQFLFHLHHNITEQSATEMKEASPMPKFVDTGITVVTQQNVDSFYAK
jgi:ribose transport system substrate-binding protein